MSFTIGQVKFSFDGVKVIVTVPVEDKRIFIVTIQNEPDGSLSLQTKLAMK
jgi:hypothetical protein